MTSTRSSPKERKNSQFRRVFWWQLKYNRILTIFYSLFMLAFLPCTMLVQLISNSEYYKTIAMADGFSAQAVSDMYTEFVAQKFNSSLSTLAVPVCVVFILCYTIRAFGFMHTRRSVDLFHAIPVRRAPLLMGSYMAGLFSICVPLAASVGLTELVCVYYQVPAPIGPVMFWEAFGVTALLMAAFLTMTVFLMVVSGTLVNYAISLAAVLFGWPCAVFIVNLTMSLFLPGYVSVLPSGVYTALCPFGAVYHVIPNTVYYMLEMLFPDVSFGEPGRYLISPFFLLWWILFTLVLLGGSVFYYCRRKSECAENHFSFALARGCIRSLLSVGAGLGLGAVLGVALDSNLLYLVGIVIGALFTHIIYQIIMVRSFRRMWLTIPAYVFTIICTGAFLYVLYNGGLGYVQRIPDPAQVEKVEFSLPAVAGDESKDSYLASYAGMNLYAKDDDWQGEFYPSFKEEASARSITNLHSVVLEQFPGPYLPFEQEKHYSTYPMSLTYTMKDGSTLLRSYNVPIYAGEGVSSALAEVHRQPEYQAYELFWSSQAADIDNVYVCEYTSEFDYDAANDKLTPAEKEQVWNTFVSELDASDFSDTTDLLTREEANKYLERENKNEDDMENWAEYSGKRTYAISIQDVKVEQLKPATKALVDAFVAENEIEKPIVDVGGNGSYIVPECCQKTRALLDRLTEKNAETIDYGPDENENVVPAED